MCLTLISIIVIYFFYPETKKRSLEELASAFGETVVYDEKSGGGLSHEKDGNDIAQTERMR